MINIKKFIDRVSLMENRRKDVVLSLDEARLLKDEITRLLADLHAYNSNTIETLRESEQSVKVEVNGGRW